MTFELEDFCENIERRIFISHIGVVNAFTPNLARSRTRLLFIS
jgi:hypothetical protein